MLYHLLADDPIQLAGDDRLQRTPFARQIADVCDKVSDQSDSSVMALVGEWGSGKSSTLNLARDELLSRGWLVADFNPWTFSNLDSLLQNFFLTFGSILPDNRRVRRTLGAYAERVAPLGAALSLAGLDGSKVIKGIGDLLKGDQSIRAQQSRLEEELRRMQKPILIALDDLDRLQPDELLMVFKLVRLVARLPNVYYLLTYDEQTLLDVLQRTELANGDGARARDYLEKIVQVRLDLPALHERQLGELVDSAIDDIQRRSEITINESDLGRLSTAYHKCMKYYLNKPRAINRFFGQVDALLPLVMNETNFVDFVLITFLRTFESGVYHFVRERKDDLTKPNPGGRNSTELSKEKTIWVDTLKELSSRGEGERLINLLSVMFLPIYSLIHGTNFTSEFLAEYDTAQRIGSSLYFDRYFQFGISKFDIADSTLRAALGQLDNLEQGPELVEFRQRLKSEPGWVLEKLSQIDDIESVVQPRTLIRLLATAYDDLPEGTWTTSRPKLRASLLVQGLLNSVEPDELPLAIDEIRNAGGLQLVRRLCMRFAGKDNYPDWWPVVCSKMGEYIKSLLVEMTGQDIADVEPNVFIIAFYTAAAPIDDEIRTFVRGQVMDGTWSIRGFLGRMVTDAVTPSGELSTFIGGLDLDRLDKVVGLEFALDQIGDLIDSEEIDGFEWQENEITAENRAVNKELFALATLRRYRDERSS